jgi:hypothetical protein
MGVIKTGSQLAGQGQLQALVWSLWPAEDAESLNDGGKSGHRR